MKRYMIPVAVGGMFAFGFASFPANALSYVPANKAAAVSQPTDLVQVKANKTARPYGWSQGRKVGWRGGRVPPGQRNRR